MPPSPLPLLTKPNAWLTGLTFLFIALSLAHRYWVETTAQRDVNFSSDLAEVRAELKFGSVKKVLYAAPAAGFRAIRRFGEDNREIRLVQARDELACGGALLARRRRPRNPSKPVFVVIKRGECSFSTKISHAKKADYDGVLVLDTAESFFNMTVRRNLNPCALSCVKADDDNHRRGATWCEGTNQLPSALEPSSTCCTLQAPDLVRMQVEEEEDSGFVALFVSVLDAPLISNSFESTSDDRNGDVLFFISPRKSYTMFGTEFNLPLFFSRLDPSVLGIYLVGVGAFVGMFFFLSFFLSRKAFLRAGRMLTLTVAQDACGLRYSTIARRSCVRR